MENIQKSIVIYSILSNLIFAAACLNLVTQFSLLALLSVSLLAIIPLRRISLDVKANFGMPARQRKMLWISLLVIFLFFSHVLILPPYMRDDVIYHLLVPKQLFASGGFTFDPYNINSNFPMAFEMPLVLSFLSQKWGSPFLVNFMVLMCLCLSFYIMAIRIFKVRHQIALCAMILMATTPVVYDQVRSCYVELFMSLLVLLTFYNYYLFRTHREQVKFWYLTMLFSGLLCATKYTGGVFVIFILAVEFFAGKDRGLYYRGALISAAVCLPWYLKNWIQLGNPVFPLLGFLFPSEFVSVERFIFYKHLFADYHSGKSLIDYVLLPWRLLTGYVLPIQAGRLGFGGKLSFYYVSAFASLCTLLIGRQASPLDQFKKVIAFFFACYMVFWAITSQQVRFLLPVAILASMPGLSIVDANWRKIRLVFFIVCGFILAQNMSNIGSIMISEKIFHLVRGQITKEQFLDYHMPISHNIAVKLNSVLKNQDAHILAIGNFGRNYYYDVQVLANTYYEAEILANAFKTGNVAPRTFENFIKKEKITHLLLNHAYLEQFFLNNSSFDMAALNKYLSRMTPLLSLNAVVVYKLNIPH